MENPNVFVSHAQQDVGFVSLLVKLLRFHRIDAWFSEFDFEPGDAFREEIVLALSDADSLIAVVSTYARQSKWVEFEIRSFQARHPKGKIVPLRVDDTEPGSIDQALGTLPFVDFRPSMSAGFDELLHTFGRRFLVEDTATAERRIVDRRARTRSHALADRRQSPLVVRLRKGFWLAFYRATELEKHSEFRLYPHNIAKVVDGVLKEADRYTFVRKSSGSIVPPGQAVECATKHVWHILHDWEDARTVNVIEAVAEQLCVDHEIAMRQRRAVDRRRHERKVAGV